MPNQVTYHGPGGPITQNPGDANYIQQDPFINVASPIKQIPFPMTDTIKLSGRDVDFSVTTLGNTIHPYSSILYSDIQNLSLYFADWGFKYHVKEGPLHTITVTVPFDTISQTDFTETLFTAEQWEIVPKQTTRAITSAPLYDINGTPYYLPQVYKVAIELAYQNKTATITLPPATITNAQTAGYVAQANLILQLRRAGIQGTYSFTQTLKRTACVDFNNINGAFETLADIQYRNSIVQNGSPNPIFATSDIIQKYAIPPSTQVQMLPSYIKQITVGSVDQIQLFAFAGWVVKAPVVQSITKNKLVYQQELEWDEWLQYQNYIVNADSNIWGPTISTNPNGSPLVIR